MSNYAISVEVNTIDSKLEADVYITKYDNNNRVKRHESVIIRNSTIEEISFKILNLIDKYKTNLLAIEEVGVGKVLVDSITSKLKKKSLLFDNSIGKIEVNKIITDYDRVVEALNYLNMALNKIVEIQENNANDIGNNNYRKALALEIELQKVKLDIIETPFF